MKKLISFTRCAVLSSVLLALGATAAPAQSAGGHGAAGGHAMAMQNGGSSAHESMQMGGGMIMLGTAATDHIKAMAHLRDLHRQAAQNAGMMVNFMVAFEAEGKAGPISQGRAAVKVTGPDGRTGGAVGLAPQEGFFSTDLNLASPGHYVFTVGTKLTDGKTRQFSFSHDLK